LIGATVGVVRCELARFKVIELGTCSGGGFTHWPLSAVTTSDCAEPPAAAPIGATPQRRT